ncbi:hypothetical protein Tco_0568002 [Tanacetum coccineum]
MKMTSSYSPSSVIIMSKDEGGYGIGLTGELCIGIGLVLLGSEQFVEGTLVREFDHPLFQVDGSGSNPGGGCGNLGGGRETHGGGDGFEGPDGQLSIVKVSGGSF